MVARVVRSILLGAALPALLQVVAVPLPVAMALRLLVGVTMPALLRGIVEVFPILSLLDFH